MSYFYTNPFYNNLQRQSNNHKMCQIRDFEEDIVDNNDQDAIFQLKYFSNNLKVSVFWVFDEKIKKNHETSMSPVSG